MLFSNQQTQGSFLKEAGASAPVVFFQNVHQLFRQACGRTQEAIDYCYTIAGYSVRLNFASRTLVPYIAPAFKHLLTRQTSTPDLTICLWDSASTKTEMPAPPWSHKDYIARSEIRGFNDERIMTTVQQDFGILNMLDRQQNVAMFWIQDARQIPYYETGAPLLRIWHSWMAGRGRQLVHAGAVGLPEGGVLLAGRGGTGKSTTALSCVDSGLFYAGDDYVILNHEHPPRAFSLFNTGKLDADNVWRLPHLKPAISNLDKLGSEKALLFLHDFCPEKIVKEFPVKAVLLPRRRGFAKSKLSRASQRESLQALAPSTIFQLPHTGPETLSRIAAFVRQVPAYFLDLGPDVSAIPQLILKVLSDEDPVLD